jgi:DNA-binding LacI/PurR family transcriptional regulator
MKITLKDIADQVNVSVSTVSRVLNNGATSISSETRNEIFRVSQELGYQKSNDRKKNGKNGKKIACILHKMKDKYQDPYFSEIIFGIERELIEQGQILSFTYEEGDLSHNLLPEEFEADDLGVIVVGPFEQTILQTVAQQVDFVISVGGIPKLGIDYVTIDFEKAAETAVNYLIQLNHKKIACISASSSKPHLTEKEDGRFIGYKKAMTSHNLPLKPEWIENGYFTIEGGYAAMKRILEANERPSAVFIASDLMAHGAYRAIQEVGLTISGDISIISFDDIEMSEYVNPPLTTIRVYKEDMGRLAVKMLLERMEGNIRFPLTTYLPTELIVRKSCGQLI